MNKLLSKLTSILEHYGFLRPLRNSAWLIADKATGMILSLTVGVWVARYLGPTRYGALSFAMALVGLVGAFATLGLRGIVVRELVEKPSQKEKILTTSGGLRAIGAVIAYTACAVFALTTASDRTWLILIIGLTLLFQPFKIVTKWFDAQVESKYIVISGTISKLLSGLMRVGLVLSGASLIFFAGEAVATALVFAAALLYFFWGTDIKLFRRGNFDLSYGKKLLSESWPLILSGLSASVFLKIDQVLLGEMSTESEVGIYAVAVRLSEFGYFLPGIFARSLLPGLIEVRENQGEEAYERRYQQIYDITFTVALALAVGVALLSEPVINLLYGKEFAASATILTIHIWASIFVFNGILSNNWLLTERLLKFPLLSNGVAAVINILLNLVLIPEYGAIGAAIATVISYSIAYFFMYLVLPSTRPAGLRMLNSLLGPIRLVRRFVQRKT